MGTYDYGHGRGYSICVQGGEDVYIVSWSGTGEQMMDEIVDPNKSIR